MTKLQKLALNPRVNTTHSYTSNPNYAQKYNTAIKTHFDEIEDQTDIKS